MIVEKFLKMAQKESQNEEALSLMCIRACLDGHLDKVRYLLTSPNLKEHARVSHNKYQGFLEACERGHFEIVRYLIQAPELATHITSDNLKDGLKSACFYKNLDIVKYLILDCDIAFNDETKFFLNSPNENYQPFNIFINHKDVFKEIVNIFEARELEKQLNALSPNNNKEKKPKL
jgi:hypothetical protein